MKNKLKKLLRNLRKDTLKIIQLTGQRLIHPDRRTVVFCHDTLASMLALQMAYWLYYGDNLVYFSDFFLAKQMAIYWCFCAGFYTLFQTYRPLWKYTNVTTVIIIAVSVALATGLYTLLLVRFSIESIRINAMVGGMAGAISWGLMVASRLVYRFSLRWGLNAEDDELRATSESRALVYGTNQAIKNYLNYLQQYDNNPLDILGIVTDKDEHVGQMVAGYPIVCTLNDLDEYVRELNAEGQHPHQLLAATHRLSSERVRKLFDFAISHNMELQKVPLLENQNSDHLPEELLMEDLFSEHLHLESESPLGHYFQQQKIMVIGSGGALGQHLLGHLLTLNATNLVICDSSHTQLAELKDLYQAAGLNFVLTKGYTEQHYDRLINQFKPTVLICLDSITEETVAIENSLETIEENLLVPLTLATLSQKHQVGLFINTKLLSLFSQHSVILPLSDLLEAWCQFKDAAGQATRYLTVRLGPQIHHDHEWLRTLRLHAKHGKKCQLALKETLDRLTTPQGAALTLLKSSYLFTVLSVAKISMEEQEGINFSRQELLHIISNLYDIPLRQMEAVPLSSEANSPLITFQKAQQLVENDTLTIYGPGHQMTLADIENKITQLGAACRAYNRKTALALLGIKSE